jgi:hypothetical protein
MKALDIATNKFVEVVPWGDGFITAPEEKELKAYQPSALSFFSEEQPQPVNYPVPLANPDWSKLINTAVSHLATYDEDNDDKHYIYEEAMQAIFGPDIFSRLREIHK